MIDTFIPDLTSKTMQERLCSEPKADPQDAVSFAVGYEEGDNQHKTYEERNADREIKQEPVVVVNERKTVHKIGPGSHT